MPPLLIQVLLPSIVISSPERVARVDMAPASDPASASLRAKPASRLPRNPPVLSAGGISPNRRRMGSIPAAARFSPPEAR